jgi:hypothetical protein
MTGDTMRTDKDLTRAAQAFEAGEGFGPMEEIDDLRRVAEAQDAVKASDAQLREAVAAARANGRSWARVGVALGMSRQAAHERFGAAEKAHA